MTDESTDVAEAEPEEHESALIAALVGEVEPGQVVDEIPGTEGIQRHPDPRQYVLIAVVLCVITALEVGMYYLEGDVSDNLLIACLAVAAGSKFFLVAAWYMHMKTDPPFFRRLFLVGMIGATIVYSIALLTFASTVLAS